MRILFVVTVLKGIGGIETSLINLLNNLKGSSYDIHLCVLGNYISKDTNIPENVNIEKGNKIIKFCCSEYKDISQELNIFDKIVLIIVKIIKRIVGYRAILLFVLKFMHDSKKYDIAISYANDMYKDVYSGGCEDYVISCVKSRKKVAWIHNDARQHRLTYNICKKKYRKFDNIVNVSNGCKKIFDDIIPEYKDKSIVVTNTLCLEEIAGKKSLESPYNNEFNIVTVARIENQQKRIDRIIESCAIIKESGIKNFKWTIVGDGPDLDNLIQMAKSKDVLDVVHFVGRKSNPIPYIQYADVFVQTSEYEAYSMVIIEALSLGIPCICTNYDSVTDIITDNYNGWIVKKDIKYISNKVIHLIKNKELLKNVKENCLSSSIELNKQALNSFEKIIF